jgi:hypothetical protein
MLERIPKLLLPIAIIMALAAVNSEAAPAANGITVDFSIPKGDTAVSVCDGGRPVLRYRCVKVPMKPYVDRLFSPRGVQVLRDSPHDHKHHHGLMFGVTVDGVDFWGEVGQGFGKEIANVYDGTERGGFGEQLEWIGPTSKNPLLVELRLIHVLKAPDLGATLIEWRSNLRTPPGKKTAVLTGAHYVGLGMRFVQSMDTGGRFFNADGKPGEIVRGDERLTPVKWCAYTAKADGKPVTVAIFDHPKNLRYPAKMFTMSTPFAYLSATRNEWKEPITIKAGKPLDLRYGVAVWDGTVDKKAVEKLYQHWLKLSSDK